MTRTFKTWKSSVSVPIISLSEIILAMIERAPEESPGNVAGTMPMSQDE